MKINTIWSGASHRCMANDKVIDLNRALANYLRDQRGRWTPKRRRRKNSTATGAFHCFWVKQPSRRWRAIEHATKEQKASFTILKMLSFTRLASGGLLVWVAYAAHLATCGGSPSVTGDLAQITRWPKREGQWGFGKLPVRLRTG